MQPQDADRIRDALRAHMAAHGLKPTRWALDAGLSERTLSHFLSGHSKSISPGSLGKLASHRGLSIATLLGFAPRWADMPAEPRSEAGEAAVGMFSAIAGEMRSLKEEVRALREEMRAARGRGDPGTEKP